VVRQVASEYGLRGSRSAVQKMLLNTVHDPQISNNIQGHVIESCQVLVLRVGVVDMVQKPAVLQVLDGGACIPP
jgi:hypothetical protein